MRENEKIHIKGARENNLKNIEVELPRGKITVFTGVSGSGKSSLAFDTIYAEGARQYLESLSAKTRANLAQIPRPDVDFIHGLSPVIAIEQRTAANSNPRTSVADATEISDYARILWALAGTQFCPEDGGKITKRALDDCIREVEKLPAGTKILICAPVGKFEFLEIQETLESLLRKGFQRVRISKNLFDLDEILSPEKIKNLKKILAEIPAGTPKISAREREIEVVVDRLVVVPEARSRLADSLELAFKEGENAATIVAGTTEIPLRIELACSICGKTYEQLSPKNFSATHPEGACSCCGGIGSLPKFLPELVVPDASKSVLNAIKPWKYGAKRMITQRNRWLKQLSEQVPFDLKSPWKNLVPATQKLILFGSGEREFLLKTGRAKAVKRRFEGVLSDLKKTATTTNSLLLRSRLAAFQSSADCEICGGKRLNKRALSVKLAGTNIGEFLSWSVPEALAFVKNLRAVPEISALEDARSGLEKRLEFLEKTGLAYLSLNRNYNTLSGGEAQRVRLAAQLGLGLVGVTYVLDEPSVGLHPADHFRLISQLKNLRDRGNTILVVEHDSGTIEEADFVVEIGAGAGTLGGNLIFSGTLGECLKSEISRTGQILRERKSLGNALGNGEIAANEIFKNGELAIFGAEENNLKNVDIAFPRKKLSAICGVSGSGKSSLINGILGNAAARKINRAKIVPGKHKKIEGLENFSGFVRIDQSPIGRSPRSNPATFTGIFDHLRKIFAETNLAKIRGYDAGRFSFNKRGGRCEKCQGDGQISLDMQFLGEAWIECPSCRGARYNRETLEVLFKGKNVSEILKMTISEAEIFFKNQPKISRILKTLSSVGLGYLTLGQPAQTLSGGEAQRLKLSLELSKNKSGETLYLLDEPTTGLHWDDVEKLLAVLKNLRDRGNTILVIEHNCDVLRAADWLVEIGPEGGKNGGNVIFTGTPFSLKKFGKTPTANFL